MRVGGVTLERGKIVNMVLDGTPTPPNFDTNNAGEFTFSLSDRVLRFNDGEQLIALNTTISEDPNLKASLGSNWLNEDLSFNPVPFNDLPGISGLDSTDSLFDVIDQLSVLIDVASVITIDDIDVSAVVVPDMSVLAWLSGDLIFLTIEQVLEGSEISLTSDNLKGFDLVDFTWGAMVLIDEKADLVSQKVNYTYRVNTASFDHRVVHNLGTQYCSVYCIDPAANTMIAPTGVDFTNANELVVHLPTKTGLLAFVRNFDPPIATPVI